LLFWAVLLLAYSNSFHGGLLFDSAGVLLEDPRIRAATTEDARAILTQGYWHDSPSAGLYRPVVT
jgi:hypothetical protein